MGMHPLAIVTMVRGDYPMLDLWVRHHETLAGSRDHLVVISHGADPRLLAQHATAQPGGRDAPAQPVRPRQRPEGKAARNRRRVLADAVRAGQLLLSHLSPALDAQRDAVKASIAAHYAGGVVFAQDGQRLAP